MSFAIVAGTVVAAGGAAYSANQQKKAAAKAAEAGRATPVDIKDVSKQAEDQALRNIIRSREVEQNYDPFVAASRDAAIRNFLQQVQQPSATTAKANELALGGYDSPAIKQAVEQAMALSNSNAIPVAELPVEVSNQATRKALATAAGVGGGGLNLGRDLVARDLGLTSLQLGQQAEQNKLNRIQSLLGAGQSQFGVDTQRIGALANLGGQDFTRALSAAQFTQTLQRPEVGLDPTAIANLATGNVSTENQNRLNQANMIQQQANINSQMYGQLAGAIGSGLTGYFGQAKPTNPTKGTVPNYAVNYQPNPAITGMA